LSSFWLCVNQANRLTTALGTVRAAEHAGGVLSASLTREHLALTAEFLKGEE
jgi:ubiquinol-cytochrome c reductase core subunit 2